MGGKGSGGHNKKSLAEHVRSGTYRQDRHGPLPDGMAANPQSLKKKAVKVAPVAAGKEVVPSPQLPIPIPDWMDEYAQAAFRRVCQILVDYGTLQDVNHATLEGYCSAYSKAVRADQIINKGGFTIKIPVLDKAGNVISAIIKKRPEVDISIRAWGQVKMFAVELGITSAKGKVETEEELSPLEKVLREAERKPR